MSGLFPTSPWLNELGAQLFLGFYLGFIFLSCLNEILLRRGGDVRSTAWWYCGFFVCLSAILFITQGWPEVVFGSAIGEGWLATYYMTFIGAFIFGNLFIHEVFDLRRFHPMLDRLVLGLCAFDGAFLIANLALLFFFRAMTPFMASSIFIGAIHSALFVALAVFILKDRSPGAGIYFSGFACTMVGTWIYVVSVRLNPQLSYMALAMYAGVLCNAFCHSLVLRGRLALREAERLEARDRLFEAERLGTLGAMSAALAHDMANPLAVIENDVSQLSCDFPALSQELEDCLPPDARIAGEEGAAFLERSGRALESLSAACERLRALLSSLRSFGRGGSAKGGNERFDLRDLASDSLAFLGAVLKRDGIAVEFDSGDEPSLVDADHGELERAVLNILMNSRQALVARGEPGKITVKIGKETGRAVIRICDDGPGISGEARAGIGRPFFRTPGGKASGLGLYMSRKIVEEAGGELAIGPGRGPENSRAAGGCEVALYLPSAREN
jgi:signal transduction histidine kinase